MEKDKLAEENERLRKALEYYAKCEFIKANVVQAKISKVARQALGKENTFQ